MQLAGESPFQIASRLSTNKLDTTLSFQQLVLSWNRRFVQDEIKLQSPETPAKFRPQDYLLPLLEETRATVNQQFAAANGSEAYQFQVMLPNAIKNRGYYPTILFDAEGSIPAILEPGFVYNLVELLITAPQQTARYFAFVQNLPTNKLKVMLLPDCHEDFSFESLLGEATRCDAIYLGNYLSHYRMFSACQLGLDLDLLTEINQPKLSPLELSGEELSEKQQDCLSQLNKPQAAAAFKFLAAKRGVTLVQGPPGTGKSTLVTAVISALFSVGKSAFVTGPSNRAVLELLVRFLKKYPQAPIVLISSNENLPKDVQEVALYSILNQLLGPIKELIKYLQRIKKIVDFGEKHVLSGLLELKNIVTRVQQRYQIWDEVELQEFQQMVEKIAQFAKGMVQTSAGERNELDEQECEVEFITTISGCVQILNDLQGILGIDNREVFAGKILNASKVFFGTLSATAEMNLAKLDDHPRYYIVDEAAQALTPDIFNLFSLIQRNQPEQKIASSIGLLLVGDPQQLPAMVVSKNAKQWLGTSLLETLMERSPENLDVLNIQYRMLSCIGEITSMRYYRGLLQAGRVDADQYSFAGNMLTHPVAFVDVEHGSEVQDSKTRSYSNRAEASAVLRILRHIRTTQKNNAEIGVITFYSAQVTVIEKMVKEDRFDNITVATVDGFQGAECSIIIVSFVRADNRVGFIADPKRLNVALSRAREKLVMVGNKATLATDSELSTLLGYLSQNKYIHSINLLKQLSPYTQPSKTDSAGGWYGRNKKQHCTFYAQGNCRQGNKCRFLHTSPDESANTNELV